MATSLSQRIEKGRVRLMEALVKFRDKDLIQKVIQGITKEIDGLDHPLRIMEVCGTHTMSIFRHGIKSLLPQGLTLLSGPGCPVCVTPKGYIDQAITYAQEAGVILATFGDMLKVPGSTSSLERERARGKDIRVVYSPLAALRIAQENPSARVIFLGVGFETTAPLVAATIIEARERAIMNYFVFSAHKCIPPALKFLAEDEAIQLNGLLLPPHVSAVIGSGVYNFLARDYKLPGVITGFEPLDILMGIWMLIKQNRVGQPLIETQYRRSVKDQGNPWALDIMSKVFQRGHSLWRGLGNIPESGSEIREAYYPWSAVYQFPPKINPVHEVPDADCLCGQILRGVKIPTDCPLFQQKCTPTNPYGPCMVSSEGTCSAYFRYGG